MFKPSGKSTTANSVFETVYSKRSVHHVNEWCGFFIVAGVILIGALTRYHLYYNLPKGLTKNDLLHQPNAFIAERAWHDLKMLTNIGSRITGSYSNEVLAVDFLKREISRMKQLANKNQLIELDIQLVSGSLWRETKQFGMTSAYRDVQNVIVKLHGESKPGKNSSVLVNCHFDSVPESPGASDDGLHCAVLLEILRIFSRQSQRLQHSIIFLFNGAEETGLQASHGFITQHKWASEIKAFINLESVGSGGKEILFQATPKSYWLIELYGKVAPYPMAQVAAEEIFSTGLIPSDTDFRIFRDFANISGLDFAHFINGYRYHTKFDHINYLSPDVIQHTGENILELLRAVATHLTKANIENKVDSKNIYYDILGKVFISYSAQTGNIINYLIVICSVVIPYLLLSRASKGINQQHLRYEIFLGFLVNMISLVASNALCYALAYDLDTSGKSMAWYSNTVLCVPTYCLVSLCTQSVAHFVFSQNKKSPFSLALQTQAKIIGTCFFWGIFSAALTLAGIRLAYAIVLPLGVTTLTNLIIGILNYQNSIRKWLYVYILGQIIVLIWTTNLFHMVLGVLIPTAGRSGGLKNPEVIIAAVCCSLTFLATSFLTPLIVLLRTNKNFFLTLFAIFVITRCYIIPFTSVGFPYRDDKTGYPCIQRHMITHTMRTLYDKEGNIRYTDSGFWFLNTDRNALKTIESLTMPEEPIPQEKNILCKNELFCGLPVYNVLQLAPGGFWVPGPPPSMRVNTEFNLINHDKLSSSQHRLEFHLKGETFTSLQIRTKKFVTLERWSFSEELPQQTIFNNESAYFVMISYGLQAKEFNVTLDLKTKHKNHNKALVDITLVTFKYEHHQEHSTLFANMLAKLPKWTFAIPSVASLRSWTF